MSDIPFQTQLSVNQTASSVVSFTMGALGSLADDNVQPVVYVVCDKLGATLTISDNTLRKIEAVVVPPTTPAPVAFLKASIGFFSQDTATLLGQHHSGRCFLALAAALTSALPLFDAARAVEIMLPAVISASDPIPSTRNIKSLLESLEPRFHRVGFANDIAGWQVLLHQIALPLIETRDCDEHLNPTVLLGTYPSPEMVDRLVDAFRQVGRLGLSTVTGLTIRVCSAVPWVIAFTKWSLGAPPRVCFDDHAGKDILPPTNSVVTLLIPRHVRNITGRGQMSVSIHHTIGSPCELLAPSTSGCWTGMVSIKVYGQLLLQELGFESEFRNLMIREALGFAIPQCLDFLHISSFVPYSMCEENLGEADAHELKGIHESLMWRRFNPLPNRQKIAAAYKTLFSLPHQLEFGKPTPGMLVSEYPKVGQYLQALRSRCECTECSAKRGYPGDSILECDVDGFYQRLSRIIATVLALSLFDVVSYDPDSLLLSIPLAHIDVANNLEEAIETVLEQGVAQRVDAQELLAQARGLLGHNKPESEVRPPVMTSARGQVLFPTLLERRIIVKDGYMALSCIPGILKYENEAYKETESGIEHLIGHHGLPLPDTIPPVVAPLNLFPGVETCWEVTKRDNRRLCCTLRVRSRTDESTYGRLNPIDNVLGLSNGLLIEGCSHPPSTPLDHEDKFASYCEPLGGILVPPEQPSSHVAVMAVHGADDLRLVSVSKAQCEGYKFFILRGNACLACCLTLCRLANVHQLIL